MALKIFVALILVSGTFCARVAKSEVDVEASVGAPYQQEVCSRENHEVYSETANPCNTCSFLNSKAECKSKPSPGCDCKSGYARNDAGKCIPKRKCGKCPINEVYCSCVNPCNDCKQKGTCVPYKPLICQAGCDCKPGFYRNDRNRCVSERTCSKRSAQ